jgi:hypothetical protein
MVVDKQEYVWMKRLLMGTFEYLKGSSKMMKIDVNKVPENPDSFSGLSPRSMVLEVIGISDKISHIEAINGTNGTIITVEMTSGDWLTVPKSAIVWGKR